MAANPPVKSGGFDLSRKIGPLPMWGWIAVAVVGVIIYRRLSGSSSSAAQTGATSTNATVPTETVTTAAGTYTGPVGYDPLGGGSGSGSGSEPLPVPDPFPDPGSGGGTISGSPGSQSPSPGGGSGTTNQFADPQTTTLAGNEYYILGGTQANQDTQTYNVTNGAPVYFTWTGNGTPTQGPPPANATGIVAYTPTSTPLSQIQGPGQATVVGG